MMSLLPKCTTSGLKPAYCLILQFMTFSPLAQFINTNKSYPSDPQSRSVNTIGQITEHAESQKHGVYLHLLTKLGQSCHGVYHVQPIVTVYTPQNL